LPEWLQPFVMLCEIGAIKIPICHIKPKNSGNQVLEFEHVLYPCSVVVFILSERCMCLESKPANV